MGATCIAVNCVGSYFCCSADDYQGNKIFQKINTNLILEGENLSEEGKRILEQCEQLLKETEEQRQKIADKVRKCNYKENNTSIDNFEPKEYEEKTTETKILYKTNLDENGKEVLNENLFKYRKKEFSNKQMRKTFTGNFYQRRGSQPKDKKGETFYNYSNKYSNNKTNFNNNAFKSYYGGFKGNNIYNKNKN